MISIKRALISVSNKEGLEDLGQALAKHDVSVISTGGTAAALKKIGVAVTEVQDVTGFPECLDGRVKSMHPKIHAGILADRSNPAHMAEIRELRVEPIDLVVVNLYPFENAAEKSGLNRAQLIEQIDIGGPTMLRAAAKNAAHVVVVSDPADYPEIIAGLDAGGISKEFAASLAIKVFRHTAIYDGAITARLEKEEPERSDDLGPRIPLAMLRVATLRYGENPHQRGAVYRPAGQAPTGLAALKQLQGKELSYNNYLDMEAAYKLVHAFSDSAVVVVKHLNPCGVGFDSDPEKAYRRALATDPLSAFGGIVALNRPLTKSAAGAMGEIFLEVIIAPEVEPAALETLEKKKNLRVIQALPDRPPLGFDIRSVSGAWLIQSPDTEVGDTERKCVTKRAPTPAESKAMERAWIMARYAKSNTIVIGGENGLVGLGCGQTSRVDAVKQAGERAARADLADSVRVLASDAFFPFRDGIDAAAKAGATAIIQPGGSVKDKEVIQAADKHGMAMVFTHRRTFRH